MKNRIKNQDRHPHIDQSDFLAFEEAINKYKSASTKFSTAILEKIRLRKEEILELASNDLLLEEFKKHFTVGREYKFSEIFKISEEGKLRYSMKIPPGYEDNEKNGFQAFGDLIIWKQIIEYATEKKKNIVFVCNDLKEDWCVLDDNVTERRIKSPRPELIKEFSDETGKRFWMYTPAQFIHFSNQYLRSKLDLDEFFEYLIKAQSAPKLSITEAFYYTDIVSINVKEKLISLIKDNTLSTLANNDLVGDPHPNVPKKLRVKYQYGDQTIEKIYEENEAINLP